MKHMLRGAKLKLASKEHSLRTPRMAFEAAKAPYKRRAKRVCIMRHEVPTHPVNVVHRVGALAPQVSQAERYDVSSKSIRSRH